MIPLAGVEAFVAIVRAGSFVGAAGALELTTSAVSRSVARLERALGARLLHRTTRKVTLTDEGRAYYEHCAQLLETFAQASEAVAARSAAPRGRLRVDVPVSLGRLVLLPALPHFLERHPLLELQLGMNDRVVDLLEEGIDAAVRIGELRDSGLVAVKVGQTRWVTVAAPLHLKGRPTVRQPRDLAQVDCVNFFYPSTGKPRTWEFRRAAARELFEPPARLLVGNAEAAVDAAAAGLGALQILDFLVEPAVREGRLVRLLRDWEVPGPPISVVYPSNRYVSARVRAFVDFVRETVAAHGSE
jgi:LysR family transcriptional regulator for bpeEF and oprC